MISRKKDAERKYDVEKFELNKKYVQNQDKENSTFYTCKEKYLDLYLYRMLKL